MTARDLFAAIRGSGTISITPSDSTVLANVVAIYVGGAGDVAIMGVEDTAAVVFKAPPVGTIIPIRAKKVMATGTTATLLVAITAAQP
jgi:hypothetical protein